MLRLRPYRAPDAKTIVSWIGDEYALRLWCADNYAHFPVTAEDMNAKYDALADADWFYPVTAFDESGIVGHMTLRFTDAAKTVLRFSYVIVDPARRGQGCGKEMLTLALKAAFGLLGAEVVALGVFDNNPDAFHCYRAVGFREGPPEKTRRYPLFGSVWACREMEMTAGEYRQGGGTGRP